MLEINAHLNSVKLLMGETKDDLIIFLLYFPKFRNLLSVNY